jgi:tetratricopeptide (TPR) repeat protein
MSNITPLAPSFVFGYWRPWKDNSNFIDSFLDYARDTSLLKYGADTVGKYINQASKEQVQAINDLGIAIGRGMNVLSNQMSDVNESLGFLNRNIDIQIEQQKLSNLLLQNIAELLRVPDSEKERQHSIELGIKFFVNAIKDADLFGDALEELLKAESLMRQDYFVLHRIGCIYLYVEKYINPEKALEYFLRAAKYASVESDSEAARLANVLTNNFNTVNSELNNSEKQIGLLAADSYEKAAFASYVLGKFTDAVNYQSKAYKFNNIVPNQFLLAKYQVRNGEISEGVKNLSSCIDNEPVFAVASFKEIDLINEPAVLDLIASKNNKIDSEINKLIDDWKKVQSTQTIHVLEELTGLSHKSYEIKVSQYNSLKNKAKDVNNSIGALKSTIDAYISEIRVTTFLTFDSVSVQSIVDELIKAKDLPLEKMQQELKTIKNKVESDALKIGITYAGGIVFYLDKTGKHGLVCAEKDFGSAIWGCYAEYYPSSFRGTNVKIGASGNGVADGSGMRNTKIIVDKASWFIERGFWGPSKKTMPTAAQLCLESNHNGFTDWYLPTISELELMYKNLKEKNNFKELFYATSKYDNSVWYWSSTEHYLVDDAWYICFGGGGAHYSSKNGKYATRQVRAVRAF